MNNADDAYARNRALVSALARRDDVLLLPVLVPAGANLPPVNPLTVLLLALLGQVTAERDAFRDWITQDPIPPSDEPLRTRAAEAASNLARRDSP
ncbi:hypothetical protein [Streptomyces lavendulae]|uniref:hypothetical protein n=1 Tax=Streptomyces lavendulae TaxID=1914 RepID=UPI0024A018D7|nr:hypothetical protein [Streptomyces lavendulae]GLX22638.1 hypothetical protein Slala01_62820 [Streptomyces lavendulae subsp. lavendulae]GLX30121.1 hypothetical protein Slala02_59410 [Streptomyces lavendulae subsp. lavendulae]